MARQFLQENADDPANVKLQQVNPLPKRAGRGQIEPEDFRLLEPFRYVDSSRTFVIRDESLEATDLASVPWPFRWFVTPGGRHSLPSLLHDCLVKGTCATAASAPNEPPTRPEADDIFKDALEACGVPFVRRHLMWGSVSFATRWSVGKLSRWSIVLWVVLALAGTAAVFGPLIGVFAGWPTWTLWILTPIGIAGPALASGLWWSQWRAGIWFGYGAVLLAPATAAVVITFGIYWIVEQVARGIIALLRRAARMMGKPQPETPIAAPPPISQL